MRYTNLRFTYLLTNVYSRCSSSWTCDWPDCLEFTPRLGQSSSTHCGSTSRLIGFRIPTNENTSTVTSISNRCLGKRLCLRVPMPPGKSWIFFLENSRTRKVLEKHFGPGKSWKNILSNFAFSIGSNGKQAEIVNVPVCVDFLLLLLLISEKQLQSTFYFMLQFLQWTILRML